MRLLHSASELGSVGRRVALAIGFFDGVHLGHQRVIGQTQADARAAEALALVVTFDRHPTSVVSPASVPLLIYPLEERLRVIGDLGVDAGWLIRFDEGFSRRSGEEFVRGMVRDFGGVESICVGQHFAFGHGRSGDVALLQRLGKELGFRVHGLESVSLDGEVVSSTRIRDAIRAGRLEEAGRMLGREYALAGRVIEGRRLGRGIGFPTANLEVAGLVLPPGGVYAVWVRVGTKRFPAVLNIGHRPTLKAAERAVHVEAHLLDFAGDLYGRELAVTFVERLREERKFPSLEGLRSQITADIASARRVLDH